MEMRVYITNLKRYDNEKIVGGWFSLPIDMKCVKERIGACDTFLEYAISDYELPFDISETITIKELNYLWEQVIELQDTPIYNEIKNIQNTWFKDIYQLLDNLNKINCYEECFSLEDVAKRHVEETGVLALIPKCIRNYINYEALGEDLAINRYLLVTEHGVFEYLV